jgi:hypothetical protein
MESAIFRHLEPEFEPVAVVWSDAIPDDALQFKEGRFGCILHLFAEASRRGRIAGGSRDTIVCSGARSALGLGAELVASEEQIEHYSTVFSKGLASARNETTYRDRMEAAPVSWRPLYEYGERRHCNFEMARSWLLHGMPRYDIAYSYVLFKPLSRVESDDNARVVIFLVDPVELAGLVTLLGSVVEDTDPVQVPQGADCFRITGFPCAQYAAESPKAVLGMLDVDGRELMRRKFHERILTLAIPMPLFQRMEREADQSVFQIPGWQKLRPQR